MPDLREEFEALMPEPAAYCEASNPVNARAFSWPGLGRSPEHTAPLYTADQVRAAMQSVAKKEREECAKLCDRLGGDIDISNPDDVMMCANSLAAAIRAREGEGGAG